jgi:type II secretory pathway pseudopilin PulG
VVAERFFGVAVHPKAIVLVIIVLVIAFARPGAAAFYTEMVIGHLSQLAVAAAAFKQALRQRNTRGDAVAVHFLYGNGFKTFYIFKRGKVLMGRNGFAVALLNALLFLRALLLLITLLCAEHDVNNNTAINNVYILRMHLAYFSQT